MQRLVGVLHGLAVHLAELQALSLVEERWLPKKKKKRRRRRKEEKEKKKTKVN
jgi:hypothetical protein